MADEKAEHRARIDYPLFESMPPAYATNFVMQNTGKEFVMGFYVVFPPSVVRVVGEKPEDIKAQLSSINAVPARCVARVVLSPERAIDVTRVMVQNLLEAGISAKELGFADGK